MFYWKKHHGGDFTEGPMKRALKGKNEFISTCEELTSKYPGDFIWIKK